MPRPTVSTEQERREVELRLKRVEHTVAAMHDALMAEHPPEREVEEPQEPDDDEH